MFLLCGLLNLIVAICTYFFLTDNPSQASFLTLEEQTYFTARLLSVNKYNVVKRKFNFRHVRTTLTTDLSIWLAFFMAAFCSIQSGAISTFSATMISGFGYTAEQAALLNMPSGAVSLISCLAATYFVEYNVPRSLSTLCLVGPALTGACLMAFANAKEKGALLAGIWLINSVTPIRESLRLLSSYHRLTRNIQ